tara:strand:+ start:330 stop:1154 length:825 start_codon:yes stop_codon:yes gene_type:complete
MSKHILSISRLKSSVIAVTKGFACFFLLVITTAFQATENDTLGPDESDKNNKKLITLQSDEFHAYTNRVYRQLKYSAGQDSINEKVLALGLRGYIYLKHTQELNSSQYLTIIDFSKYCNMKRMWVINMITKKIIFNELVAHGANSGDTYAKYFSNMHSSNKSSLGFYTTGGLYQGSNDLSLKLNGLEKKFNSNAFTRGIVIHGASYVNKSIVERKQRIGRSYGCPAVSKDINKQLITTIKGGNCLFVYHPTLTYLENSKLVNANLYITVEELNI